MKKKICQVYFLRKNKQLDEGGKAIKFLPRNKSEKVNRAQQKIGFQEKKKEKEEIKKKRKKPWNSAYDSLAGAQVAIQKSESITSEKHDKKSPV